MNRCEAHIWFRILKTVIIWFVCPTLMSDPKLNLMKTSFWTLQDEFQLMTFGVGLCLLTVGVAMMIIVNVLKKCEHDAIINHLETQVDNAKRFRDSNRLLGGNKAVPEDKQILVQASNLVWNFEKKLWKSPPKFQKNTKNQQKNATWWFSPFFSTFKSCFLITVRYKDAFIQQCLAFRSRHLSLSCAKG